MELIEATLLLAHLDDHMGDWGPGWWIVMALAMAVFWGAVIVGIVWLIRFLLRGGQGREPTATEILDRRFAQGEVSVEEYRERRAHLAGEKPDGNGGTSRRGDDQ